MRKIMNDAAISNRASTVLALTLVGFATCAWALDAPAPKSILQDHATGRKLYQARCASCHDHPTDRVPSKEVLMKLGPDDLARALSQGPMQPMAKGLSRADVEALAVALTGRPPAPDLPAAPDSNPCPRTDPIEITANGWNGWSPDATNTRFQPKPGLSAQDVPRLKVKWTFAYPGSKNSQVTAIGNRLFFGSNAGRVYSLNAQSGCVYWRYDAKGGVRTAPTLMHLAGSPSGYALVFGTDRAELTLLDAASGHELWSKKISNHPRAMITGAPKFHSGLIYVPLSSSEEVTTFEPDYVCCTFRGSVVALKAKDGTIVWKTYTTDQAPKPFKNALGRALMGPAGGAIWSSPTIDAKRGVLYVATGDSYTDIDHPGSDAVIAMNLRSGAIKWVNQVTAKDNFVVGCSRKGKIPDTCPTPLGPDVDFGASVILRSIGDRDILIAGQKSGVVYGMDPDTGKTLWRNKMGEGSPAGGVEWGMAADASQAYVAIADPMPHGNPGLNAVALASGETVWHTPTPKVPCNQKRCRVSQSAPVTAIPGVVFSGAIDGHLRAYDAKTGRIVWDFDTKAQGYDTANGVKDAHGGSLDATGPVIVNGMLFQHSGYPGVMMVSGGQNLLMAFSVDGK